MVHLPQPVVGTDGSNLFDNELTWGTNHLVSQMTILRNFSKQPV
jgi:hypothetical protein